MPLLGDEQASGIRRLLLSSGEFSEIHAFPAPSGLTVQKNAFSARERR